MGPATGTARDKLLVQLKAIGPLKAASYVTRVFFDAMKQDLFPPKGIDRIFGIEMVQSTSTGIDPMPMGHLMLNVWLGFYKFDLTTEEQVVKHLLTGTLPTFISDYCQGKNGQIVPGTYLHELSERDLNEIPWDHEMLELLIRPKDVPLAKTTLSVKKVLGLRLNGSEVIPEIILYDDTFEPCPIAHAAGIPLYVQRTKMLSRENDIYVISRNMSNPDTGVSSMEWQYGGYLGPAPQVLIARSDGVEFTPQDWYMLDEFQSEMLDDGPRTVTRKNFESFAKCNRFKTNMLALEVLFPLGQKVKAKDLVNSAELNGKVGISTGKYTNGRIGVKFENRSQAVAIKVANLVRINQA